LADLTDGQKLRRFPHWGHFEAPDHLGAARTFYETTEQGREQQIKAWLENWRRQSQASRREAAPTPAGAPTA